MNYKGSRLQKTPDCKIEKMDGNLQSFNLLPIQPSS